MRIHHLVHQLCRHNQVWWVTRGPLQGPAPPGLAGHVPAGRTRPGQLFDPWLLARLVALIGKEKLELILASTWIPGLHGLLLKLLTGRPLVLDEHNVEFHLTPWLRPYEGFLCRRADQVWCVSAQDASVLQRSFGLEPPRVVPNGAGPRPAVEREAARQALGLSAARPLALFFGVLSYAANREAVEVILDELSPRLPDFDFLVAGVGSERLADTRNVRFLGFVPDLDRLMAAVDVVVAPLLTGSGTRLKVLEALAAGKPVVSTPLGVEGLELDEPGVLVRAGWDEFAAGLRAALGMTARLPHRYLWETIGEQL